MGFRWQPFLYSHSWLSSPPQKKQAANKWRGDKNLIELICVDFLSQLLPLLLSVWEEWWLNVKNFPWPNLDRLRSVCCNTRRHLWRSVENFQSLILFSLLDTDMFDDFGFTTCIPLNALVLYHDEERMSVPLGLSSYVSNLFCIGHATGRSTAYTVTPQ